MVPELAPWQVFGLALVAVAATVLLVRFATRVKPLGGVLLRLLCPADRNEAHIRVGKHPSTGKVTVLWCDRFPHGPISCNRACFTDEIAGSVVT